MRFVGSSNDIYALSFLSSTSDRSIFLPRKGCHSSFGIYPRRSEIAYVRNANGWIEEKIGGSIFIRFALLALYIYIYILFERFPNERANSNGKLGNGFVVCSSRQRLTLYRLTWIIIRIYSQLLLPRKFRFKLWAKVFIEKFPLIPAPSPLEFDRFNGLVALVTRYSF